MTWDSSNPWSMGDYVEASGMRLDEDEARLVKRAREGGHTWSVYRLHELNVMCFEARGWMRAKKRHARDITLGRLAFSHLTEIHARAMSCAMMMHQVQESRAFGVLERLASEKWADVEFAIRKAAQ